MGSTVVRINEFMNEELDSDGVASCASVLRRLVTDQHLNWQVM